jgi:hypothetical protein
MWAWAWLAMELAVAHPMSRDRYSLRAALRMDGDRLSALVVLEVPFDVVMASLKADVDATDIARVGPDGLPAAEDARRLLDTHNATIWRQLGEGLILVANGAPVPGAWGPSDSRFNGKGSVTEGFFMYVIEFRAAEGWSAPADLDLTLYDAAWPDVPMSYSAYVEAGRGWAVRSNSAAAALPARPYDLNDPAFWVDDPALRVLRVRFQRGEVR